MIRPPVPMKAAPDRDGWPAMRFQRRDGLGDHKVKDHVHAEQAPEISRRRLDQVAIGEEYYSAGKQKEQFGNGERGMQSGADEAVSAAIEQGGIRSNGNPPKHRLRIPRLAGRIMQVCVAVQRTFLPSCSRLFSASWASGRFPVNAAKYLTVSEQSAAALPIQHCRHVCPCSESKELIQQWQRIRVPLARFCILKITASSPRNRSRKRSRATTRITLLPRPRIKP